MAIIWCASGHDSSGNPLYMVLMTDPKPSVAVTKFSGVWNCSSVCNQQHSFESTVWGAGLPSYNGSPWSWFALGFHSVLPGPKLPERHFCLWMGAKLLLLRRGICGKDITHLNTFNLLRFDICPAYDLSWWIFCNKLKIILLCYFRLEFSININ